jgi:phosphoglycolate phosphatase-like HAD superfamily hydrolase
MTTLTDEQLLRAVKAFLKKLTVDADDSDAESWFAGPWVEGDFSEVTIDGGGDIRPAMRAAIEAALQSDPPETELQAWERLSQKFKSLTDQK